MPSLTHSESVDRARLIRDVEYDVHLSLNEDEPTFGCRTTVRFSCTDPGAASFIELADTISLTATLNARPVEWEDGRITLTDLGARNELVVDAVLPCVTNGDGMHRMVDPADGETYLAALCGMDIASRIFCCFDQPDIKAPIRLTVEAPSAWTVIANGVGAQRLAGSGNAERALWTFAATPPISTYLFVVCAGPWASIRWDHRGLPFGWHARASMRSDLERDFEELRQATEDCFAHYSRVFDESYPFDSFDQVMVPGHNWGALETPGCVTYRDEYLGPGKPTELQRAARATTIAHEMAHMWFGNLVTMRWWEDTWLNESFADYMGYHVADVAAGFTDAQPLCSLVRKPTGYAADQRRSTHPIAEEAESVVDVDWAFSNFDMITYAKGNAVLRQLAAWLGEEAFLAGTNAHLTAHRFGNATLDDFLAAMDAASDRDVRAWAETWLRTTGFDTIRVERDSGVPVLHRDGIRPHRFSVAMLDDEGRVSEARMVDIDEASVRIEDWADRAIVVNAGDETFARVIPDSRSWAAISANLSRIEPPVTRAMLWNTAITMCRHGEVRVKELVAMVAQHLPSERNVTVVESTLGHIYALAVSQRTDPADMPDVLASLAASARDMLASDGVGDRLSLTRVLARCSDDVEELFGLLNSGCLDTTGARRLLDQPTRWLVVRRLASLGAGGADLIDTELRRDPSADGKLQAMSARAARPTPDAKAEAWSLLVTSDPSNSQPSNREWESLSAGLWSAGQEELTAPYVERYFDVAIGIAEARGQAFSGLVGRSVPSQAQSLESLHDLRARLAAALELDSPVVLKRAWNDRLDDLDLAISARM